MKAAMAQLQCFIRHCNTANMLQLYQRTSTLENRNAGWRREWNMERSHALLVRVWKSHCLKHSEENISHSEKRYWPWVELLFCIFIFLCPQILNSGGFWLNSLFLSPFLLIYLFFSTLIVLPFFSFLPLSCFPGQLVSLPFSHTWNAKHFLT